MTRKEHLSDTQRGGPACQRGRIGGSLRGEHIAVSFDEFQMAANRCARCEGSRLFAFLERKALDAWEPEHPDAWKAQDDATVKARAAA